MASHIYFRNRGKKEDFRYLAWRKAWGKTFFWRSYLQIYLFQGFLLLIVVSPIILVGTFEQQPLGFLDFAGILIWVFGFIFEAVGDYQLSQFVTNPKNNGKILKSGLWKYTRHPNYFGEVVLWWGVFLIAFSSALGWLALASPILITFLILFVSGVPMLEKKYVGNEAYEEYAKKTNKFFPWIPKDE